MAVETIQDGNHRHGGKNWFLWGVGLAIASALPFLVPILTIFPRNFSGKGDWMAAVAGGLTEFYVTSGLILTFILPIAGIVLLGKSFSAGNQSRKTALVTLHMFARIYAGALRIKCMVLSYPNAPSRWCP